MSIKIHLELELDAVYHEYDNDRIELNELRIPGSDQNILWQLSDAIRAQAQINTEESVSKELEDKLQRIRERREMRGDYLREIARDVQREERARRDAQRGNR